MKTKFEKITYSPNCGIENYKNDLLSLDDDFNTTQENLKKALIQYLRNKETIIAKKKLYEWYENGLISEQTYKRKLLELENEKNND